MKRGIIILGITAIVAAVLLGTLSTVDTIGAQQAAPVVAPNPRDTNLNALQSGVAASVPNGNQVTVPPPPPLQNWLTVKLPSGRQATIHFSATAGDVIVGGLLLCLVMAQFFNIGRGVSKL